MATRSERAEAVRKLVREARHGLLSTNGLEPAGIPYGSLVPVASTGAGEPVLLVSHLAQHTRNLVADGRASLLVLEPTEGDPQQAARASLLGRARRLEGDEESKARVALPRRPPGRGAVLRAQLPALGPRAGGGALHRRLRRRRLGVRVGAGRGLSRRDRPGLVRQASPGRRGRRDGPRPAAPDLLDLERFAV